MKKCIGSALSGALVCFSAASATAGSQTIDYVNWTGVDGSVNGTLAGGTINVTYSGELSFAQVNNTGTYFYTGPNQQPGTGTEYTGNPVIANAPSTSDLIGITGSPQYTDTITFSKPVTDPVMLLVSLGQPSIGTEYIFNTPFNILSDGAGWWGGPGTLLQGNANSLTGNLLQGIEGDGAIQFEGTYTSISWTGANPEYWNGFTFGTPEASTPDTASTLGLLGVALAGLGACRRFVRR